MAAGKTRREYGTEFKIDAAKLVEDQGYAVGEAAERLGIPKANLTRWLRQYRRGKLVAGHKQAQPTCEEAEVRRLRSEVKRLETEVAILKKGRRLLCDADAVKFNFIEQNRGEFPIKMLCTLMGVARSSFYAYLKRSCREPSDRQKGNEVLLAKVKSVFEASKQRYGSPRIHAAIRQQGEPCSLGRVKRLMRREGLYAVSGKKFKPKRERTARLETKNLLLEHNIRPTAINQVWQTDITYVPTDEGWLYLAGVMDGFSKRMVGYAMDDNMKTDLVILALRSAVTRRRPGEGLIHHGDKGSRYTSYRYQHELESQNTLASFTGTGACLDNAIMESFWATLKKELVYPNEPFKTRDEARLAIFEYIEVFYNRERLHGSLLYKTPEGFELTQQRQPEALLRVAA